MRQAPNLTSQSNPARNACFQLISEHASWKAFTRSFTMVRFTLIKPASQESVCVNPETGMKG
jgi:hypothetical protein